VLFLPDEQASNARFKPTSELGKASKLDEIVAQGRANEREECAGKITSQIQFLSLPKEIYSFGRVTSHHEKFLE
jgi:hypothetical protein